MCTWFRCGDADLDPSGTDENGSGPRLPHDGRHGC
jgi:hypothetical protein